MLPRLAICIVFGAAAQAGCIHAMKTPHPPQRPDAALLALVDGLFGDYDHPEVPGASVAIYRDGRIALAKAYGCADLGARAPARVETNYRLASVTKQFTAMCIMQLAERGQLAYDDPITRFFPDFPAIGRGITVRQFLGHTSGLKDYEDLIPPGRTEQLQDRDVLEILKSQEQTYFPPGTQYRYSNSGYALLALVVEQISGQDFATYLKENIFAPLGMDATVAYEPGISTVPRRALGYRRTDAGWEDADQSMTSAVLGDGGIYTSVVDYFRWDQALYTDQLVSRGALAEAFTPAKLADGTATNYGFGWRIDERNGVTVIHHNGETCGFNTAVRRVPERRLAVVVFTNRAGESAHEIADRLLIALLNGEYSLAPK